MELKKIVEKSSKGHVIDTYFSVSLIVNKNNELTVIDNSQTDWKDYVDSNTQLVETVKLKR